MRSPADPFCVSPFHVIAIHGMGIHCLARPPLCARIALDKRAARVCNTEFIWAYSDGSQQCHNTESDFAWIRRTALLSLFLSNLSITMIVLVSRALKNYGDLIFFTCYYYAKCAG